MTTLLKGARIVDGSGAPARDGHLLIEGNSIAAELAPGEPLPEAEHIVEVGGKVVAPGFIDVHSHVDFLAPMADNADLFRPLLEQGITTVVAGNCGISPAPVNAGAVPGIERIATICIEQPLDYRWSGMGDYLDVLEAIPLPVNLAQLVGHASLRHCFGDNRRGPLGEDALASCLREASRALDEGACGLSLGLGYEPGMYAPLDELSAFAAVAKNSDKPLTSHIKAYSVVSPCYPATYLGAHNVRALREMLAVARKADCRLQLSHFLVVGRRSWPTLPRLLKMLDEAHAEGLDLMIDLFPFTCGNTTVNALLPHWFLRDLPRNFQRRLALARLRLELELGFRLVGFRWSDLQLMTAGVEGWEDLCGLTVDAIAQCWGLSPFHTFLRISERSAGAAMMLIHSYGGDAETSWPLDTVLARKDCLIETDAVLRRDGYPNPASMGTFPRVLGHHVRERRLFSLEEAIRRMTGAGAERFALRDRGILAAGKRADLVVFDPDTIGDSPLASAGAQAGGAQRRGAQRGDAAGKMRPRGIDKVFVNGKLVVAGGRATGELSAGEVLRV